MIQSLRRFWKASFRNVGTVVPPIGTALSKCCQLPINTDIGVIVTAYCNNTKCYQLKYAIALSVTALQVAVYVMFVSSSFSATAVTELWPVVIALLSLVSIWSLTIVGSLKMLPAIVSHYMKTPFRDSAIVADREKVLSRQSWTTVSDYQQLYGNAFQRSSDRNLSHNASNSILCLCSTRCQNTVLCYIALEHKYSAQHGSKSWYGWNLNGRSLKVWMPV